MLYCERPDIQSTLCPFLLRYILIVTPHMWSRVSVVSLVTRLLGGRSGLRSPAGAREFSVLQNIQTGCGTLLAPSQYVGLTVFFFFSRRYNLWWVLACFTILFHNLLSLHFSLQFLTFIFFRSSSTW